MLNKIRCLGVSQNAQNKLRILTKSVRILTESFFAHFANAHFYQTPRPAPLVVRSDHLSRHLSSEKQLVVFVALVVHLSRVLQLPKTMPRRYF